MKRLVLSLAMLALQSPAYGEACYSLVKKANGILIRDYKDQNNQIHLDVKRLGKSIGDVTLPSKAQDVVFDEVGIMSIHSDSVHAWSPETGKNILSYKLPQSDRNYDQPYAATRVGDFIYMAHGRSGLKVLSLRTGQIVFNQTLVAGNGLLESSARGIVSDDRFVYIAYDTHSITKPTAKPAFAGIIIFDTQSYKVVKQLKGFDPGVTSLSSDGKTLFASFGGRTIWQYSLDEIWNAEENLPEPLIRVWTFPEQGHPRGHAAVDGQTYASCFAYRDPEFTLYQSKFVEFSYTGLGFTP